MKKLYCSTVITLLLTTLSVFLGELAKTEYKSQVKKRKSLKHQDVVLSEKTKPVKSTIIR